MASLVFPRSKCLTTVHGASETPLKLSNIPRTGYKLAESLIVTLRFAEKIYVSHELQSRLEGASGTKSRVIENGIDLDQTLKKAGSFPEPVCKRGIRHIGFLGRLVPVKRPDILLKIVKQTAHRDKLPYVFHVIGDGPLFDEFQTATARKGLSKHIVMHGFCANPLPLLATMDCLLITSDHEGLPTNLLEAMCLGIPVIAHAVGEIPRVLEFGKLGTLIESQDVNSYSDALKKCLSTDKPGHLAANMLNRVKDRYSADRNAERYLCLYQEVLSMPKADICHTFNK